MPRTTMPIHRPADHVVKLKYRADIDGLRAIAILAVVGFHAFPGSVRAGFIGVDMFFVISGFLISGIILDQMAGNRFSYAAFYARRIRRIFPALLLMLGGCWAIGWCVLFAGEYKEFGRYMAAGAGFASNVVSWGEAGYFDMDASYKPLLHLWSLAIEEQFYIVWPLVMALVWRSRYNFVAVASCIAILSFGLNVLSVGNDVTAAFYSPLSRFWELMVGSVLAYLTLHAPQRLAAGGNRYAFAGLGLIVAGLAFIDKTRAFPGWWALFPVLGTFLIVAAGENAWLNRRLLGQRPLVWVGLISYPLYLWHWPLLSFMWIMEPYTSSRIARCVVVLLSIVLAWLTYRVLERPIRFGRHSRVQTVTLCLLMTAAGAVGYCTVAKGGFPFRLASLEKQYAIFTFDESSGTTATCKAQFPEQDQCLEAIPGAPHDAVLVGDSHAYHYFWAVSPYLKQMGKNTVLMGGGGCVPFYDLESWQEGFADYCATEIKSALDYAIRDPSVKTVLLASRGPLYITGKGFGSVEANYDRHLRLTTHPELTDLGEIYAQAMRDTLGRLIKAGKQVIFLVEVPELGFDPIICAPSRLFYKEGQAATTLCAVARKDFDERTRRYFQIIASVLKDYPSVYAFYPFPYLCDDQYCWGMKNGKILYRNDNHLAPEGWELLGKAFAEEMQRAKLKFVSGGFTRDGAETTGR